MNTLKQIAAGFLPYFMVIGFCITGFSCKEENNARFKQAFQEERARSFSEKLEVPSNITIELLPQTKIETVQWLAYITAQAEIKRFESFTVQDAVDRAATVQKIMKALQETIPENFQENPILARITVLVTLSNVLAQAAENPNATAEEIAQTAEKIPVAFRSLKIQLNEIFRKGLEDFQLELEENDTIEKIEPSKLFNSVIAK